MNLSEAASLARGLMNDHGLGHWTFEFDRAPRRFGACHGRLRKISLSEYLVRLNEEDQVRNTILHEIAHALTPNERGHGPQWRRKCIEVGIRPDRCYSRAVTRVPRGSWVGICPGCGKQSHMFKKPKARRSCGRCGGRRFSERFEIIWTNPGFDPKAFIPIPSDELEEDAA